MSKVAERRARAEHANALIKIIGSYGRRFFWNEGHQRYASIEVDDRGKVWFIDDYSGRRVYTHKTTFDSRWRGFSHGGTLRSLVECMRDYIVDGTTIGIWRIATTRINGTDIWGYGRLASYQTKVEAQRLPIITPAGEVHE